MSDLDRFANHILSYGSELDADHPVRIFHCTYVDSTADVVVVSMMP